MDAGILAARGQAIATPLPQSWLGLTTAPPTPPTWASVGILSTGQIKNLQAQIGYDLSQWNYGLVGTNNQLGRYQFSTPMLEAYGLLAQGSNTEYGVDCVNYRHCWQPTQFDNGINAYQRYFYNVDSISSFLTNISAQEHLAYQRIVDLYVTLTDNGAIQSADSAEVVAGMIYVGWTLTVGQAPTIEDPNGTGAWAWRYSNIGSGANSYNSGRYTIAVLGS
jgi:hypothetical protein